MIPTTSKGKMYLVIKPMPNASVFPKEKLSVGAVTQSAL